MVNKNKTKLRKRVLGTVCKSWWNYQPVLIFFPFIHLFIYDFIP
jgi:hypothetical protein